jgi:hypothetical protein
MLPRPGPNEGLGRAVCFETPGAAAYDVRDLEAIWGTHTGALHAWLPSLVDRPFDRAHHHAEPADQIVIAGSGVDWPRSRWAVGVCDSVSLWTKSGALPGKRRFFPPLVPTVDHDRRPPAGRSTAVSGNEEDRRGDGENADQAEVRPAKGVRQGAVDVVPHHPAVTRDQEDGQVG